MAVCNNCPYYNECDYAGEAWQGSNREVVNCKRDKENPLPNKPKERSADNG